MIIKALVSSFWFIWITTVCYVVYDHYKYFYSYSVGVDFSLTSVDVRSCSAWLFLERRILSKHEALTVPHADLMLDQIRKWRANINPPLG